MRQDVWQQVRLQAAHERDPHGREAASVPPLSQELQQEGQHEEARADLQDEGRNFDVDYDVTMVECWWNI